MGIRTKKKIRCVSKIAINVNCGYLENCFTKCTRNLKIIQGFARFFCSPCANFKPLNKFGYLPTLPGTPYNSHSIYRSCTNVKINFREKEKEVLDQILGPGRYDARIRPSGVNGTGKRLSPKEILPCRATRRHTTVQRCQCNLFACCKYINVTRYNHHSRWAYHSPGKPLCAQHCHHKRHQDGKWRPHHLCKVV